MKSPLIQPEFNLSPRLTYKANLKQTRYGWLRLTPAHSVHLVAELLDGANAGEGPVLDPFCGTGTTALVCAEQGIAADTTDINPFLTWLATAKTSSYTESDLQAFLRASEAVRTAIEDCDAIAAWVPPLHQIEKWWDGPTLAALGRALCSIRALEAEHAAPAIDLLKIAFCRVMIERANVSFAHQSMSFKAADDSLSLFGSRSVVGECWDAAIREIALSAQSPIATIPRAILCDARCFGSELPRNHYACVITSPPYPNRMSYIRELRPYMYWLGYLRDGRQAGEMDWQAIGGTWGCATSLAGKWEPETAREIGYPGFADLLANIARDSPLLSRYVHKYFYDMARHCAELFAVVRPGGAIHYIVGNSKFYDTLLPVEQIFAHLFAAAGFSQAAVKTIRKRTSKKELFEHVVSARKP